MSSETEVNDAALLNVARHIYGWYKEWLREHIEPENDIMRSIDLTKPEGRFELLILARLFNNRLKEEKAIEYFRTLKQWGFGKGFSYQAENKKVGMIDINMVKNTDHILHEEFRTIIMNELLDLPVSVRVANYKGFICCAKAFSQKDLKDYINEVNNGDLLDVISRKLRSCGIFVKSFLIVREMYKAGVWDLNQKDLWMCCVPDSKIRNYLNNMGFVPKEHRIEKGQSDYDLLQLKQYSKVVWRYFNEPFEEKYFDLPLFRYLKETEEISSEEFERLSESNQ